MNRTLTYLMALFIMASCHKKPENLSVTKTYGETTYPITNTTGKPMHVSVYNTQDDYLHNTNAIIDIHLDTGAVYNWVFPTSPTMKTDYYIDWYTDDYTMTNWGTMLNAPLKEYPYGFKLDLIRLNEGANLNPDVFYDGNDYGRRNCFIDINKESTTWQAIDLRNSQYHWNEIYDEVKYHQLVFTRDMRFTYTTMNNGNFRKKYGQYIFKWHTVSGDDISLYVDGSGTPDAFPDFSAQKITASAGNLPDTVILTVEHIGDFVLVKQK